MKYLFCDYKHLKPISKVKLFFRKIKWGWQRITKGYCGWDLLDMDLWFIQTVTEMLRDFRKKHWGFPSILLDDYYDLHKTEMGISYEAFMSDQSEEWMEKAERECEQTWNGILDKIRFLFLESDEETCSKKNRYPTNDIEYMEEIKRLNDYRMDCRKKAFELFNKWFDHLWY